MSNIEPTHHVTHERRQLDTAIYIAPSLLQKLHSHIPGIRKGAEDSIAINFREACRSRYGFIPSRYITFQDLRITEIDRSQQEPHISMSRGGDPLDDDAE